MRHHMSRKKTPTMELFRQLFGIFVISSYFLVSHGQRIVCNQEAMADIVFLVDGSASIGPKNFEQIRDFLISVVSNFDIGPNKVRVGMVQFSDTPRTEFFLNKYKEKQEILNYIKTFPYKTGGTNTGLGLQFLLENHFVEQAGSRVNQRVPQIAVVITDGNSQDDVEPYAQELRQKGIKVYAIGIKDADETLLKKMASQPYTHHVYSVSDFNALQEISQNVIGGLCTTVEEGKRDQQECSEITSADIVFLVDSSDNVENTQTAEIQQFLRAFLDQLNIQPNKVKIGLAQFSTTTYQDFLLGAYANKVDLLRKLNSIVSRGGRADIGAALDFIRKNYFVRARKNVPQIAVLITNGESNDDVIVPAQELRNQGIIVFVINTGRGNLKNLQAIANSPQEEFLVTMSRYQSEELIKIMHKKVCIAVDDQLRASSPKFADIFFLVDSTASIGPIRPFLLRLVNQLNIGKDANHVGLAQFSENVAEEFLFSDEKTKSEVMTSIRNLRLRPRGVRKTGNAIEHARKNYFSTSGGSRIAQGFKQVLIVLTAGKSEDSVLPPSRTIKSDGVTMISIGVGEAEPDELLDIASPNQNYTWQPNMAEVQKSIKSTIESQESIRIFEDCKSADIADIVFIVDKSGNMGPENFQLVRKFLQDTISGLDVGTNNVRIAIVQYSDVPRADVYLNTFSDKSLILQYVRSLSYGRGKTNTGAALAFAKNYVFTKERGSRKESHVQQIAVVVTDGRSADDVKIAAADLRRSGVSVFALGIKNAFAQELREIASYPASKFVFNIESFVELDASSSILTKRLCGDITSGFYPLIETTLHKGCKFTAEADIYFLLDESGSISYADFDDMKKFILEFLHVFDIGPNKVRIGVVKFASRDTVVFTLDAYNTKADVEKAVKELIMYGGGTRTDLGLEAMIPLFEEASKTRQVRELLIIITDGKSEPVGEPVRIPAEKLRRQNVTIYAVGVKDADVAELQEISGSPKRTYYVQNYDALKQIKNKILKEICSFEACNSLWADVVFLIDGADTVDAEDFTKTKELISFAIEKLPIKQAEAQVAVVQYSSETQLEFALNEFYDKVRLQEKIMAIQQLGGKTFTGKALEDVVKYFEVSNGGRSNTLQVLILVTDSLSKDNVVLPAQALRKKNIKILTIGLRHASRTELLQISGSHEQVYLENSFASIQALGNEMIFKICNIECKQPELLDVIFLLDASGSTNKQSFLMLKRFTQAMVKMADVGQKRVRIGVIVYSDRAQTEFTLSQYVSKAEVLQAISMLQASGGRRNTAQALKYSLSYFETKHGGRRAKHISQVLCLLTDGQVADPAGLREWPQDLAQSEVNMFAIGVDQASEAELGRITGNPNRAFHVNNYEEFQNLNQPITQQLCNLTKPVCEKEVADLVFLIDGSESISPMNWTVTINSIIDIVTKLDIGPDKWRIGVAQFSDIVLSHFHLNKYTNIKDLEQGIRGISQRKQGTHTWSALKFINEYFTPENGSRINKGVSQNLLLITDGEATDNEDLNALAQLKAKYIEIFVIGIGEKINHYELVKIAGSTNRVFYETFENLQLKTTTEKVLQAICEQNIKPNRPDCTVDIGIGFDVSHRTSAQPLLSSHVKPIVDKVIHQLSTMAGLCCTSNDAIEPKFGFRLVSGNDGRVIDDFNFEKYDKEVVNKVLELRPTSTLAFNTLLLDSFREKLSTSKAGVKVVVLFTDGIDDTMVRLKESSNSLQQSGVSALLIVALSGNINYQELQFGRGYNYKIPLTINMPNLGTALLEEMQAVALKDCCNVTCVCHGPAGPPGIPGRLGEKGPPGDPGLPGHPGEAGTPGGRGLPGLNGTQGHRGCPGNRGLKGSIGYTGNRGEDGELGLDGVDGQQGDTGASGDTGLKGYLGRQGFKGLRGTPGPKGDSGVRGDPGRAGLDNNEPGAKGEIGYQGPPGDQGLNGSPGTAGDKGEPGIPGRKGPEGSPGLPSTQKGQPGEDGLSGYPGEQGPYGRNGIKGNKGDQGIPGMQGAYGSSGDPGVKGNPGRRGPRGPPGDTGGKGTPGQEGFIGPPGYSGNEGRGRQGAKGHKGGPGFPGHPGLPGEDGTKGSFGGKGSKGYKGQPGNRGRNGPPGESGEPGLNGLKGAKGSPGQKSKTECELVNYIRDNCGCCKDRIKCPGYPTELLLALDMSADVTPQVFDNIRSTAVSLLKDIDIAETNCPAGTRVAVVAYSSDTRYLFRFSHFNKKKALLEAIEGIPLLRTRNQRNIGQAMRYVAQNVFKRVRSGDMVKKVAIFLTNGPSQDSSAINTAMLELKAADINLGVIAFRDAPNVRNAIQVDETRRFRIVDAERAIRIKECVICFDPCNPDLTCGIILNPEPERVDVDLTVMMDSSWDLQATQYWGVKELLRSFLDVMDVSSEPTREDGNARLGIYQQSSVYSQSYVSKVFGLETFTNRTMMKRHILEDMQQAGGYSRLDYALEWMVSNAVLKAKAPRKKRMVVNVISDNSAKFLNKDELNYVSKLCQCNDVVMVTLTLGEKSSWNLVETLTTYPVQQHLIQLGQMGLKDQKYAQKFFRAFLRMLTRDFFPKPSSQDRTCRNFVRREKPQGPIFIPTVANLPAVPVTEVLDEYTTYSIIEEFTTILPETFTDMYSGKNTDTDVYPERPTETYPVPSYTDSYDQYTENYDDVYPNVYRDEPQRRTTKRKATEPADSELTKETNDKKEMDQNKPDKSKAQCLQDKNMGTVCSDYQARWYYDQNTQKCTHFWYGGCGGNDNRFLTEAMCIETCGALASESFLNDEAKTDVCQLAQDMGRCYNFVLRWYYNASKRECALFWYGGCEGNDNRFDTEEECKAHCLLQQNV